MLQSMTGFGKSSATFSDKKITVEIKSLNSKNLDLFVRMPQLYRQNEIALRKILEKALDRGKVECNINVEAIGNNSSQKINKTLVTSYYKQLNDLSDELNLPQENLLQTLLKMPDVFSSESEELDDEEWEGIVKVVNEAIQKHIEFRKTEGQKLMDEFTLRIENIRSAFTEIPKYESARIDAIKERIENNLEEFVGLAKVDKNRFEQELIYYLEKFDISEEKHRLENHLNYFISTLNENQSQGKKLGFITQEIGREINTLGSKSYHADMQKLVVNMKDELEKIKEQILNTL
ncbi:YicC/YloC family endoribonuclease [Crocinitomix algicola]|uniref:YicC/YloC family endoribonuclease n=1 Tax=Crocinitomix algicola TaxID=1740263 RepID=UPI000834A859|nr:YicC/YloC family endoribonuclease [Crocinitomix algicola]